MIKHEYLNDGSFCAALIYNIKTSMSERDIDNVYFGRTIIPIDDIYNMYVKCVTAFNDKYYKSFNVKTENSPVKIPVVFDIDTVELIERIIIKLSIGTRR